MSNGNTILDKVFSGLGATLEAAALILPTVLSGKAAELTALALRIVGEGLDSAKFLAANHGNITDEQMEDIRQALEASRVERNAKIEAYKARIAARAADTPTPTEPPNS